MQASAEDLTRVSELLNEQETRYRQLAFEVARGEAPMTRLIDMQDQLRELQVLAAAVQVKSSR